MKLEEIQTILDKAEALPWGDEILLGNLIEPTKELLKLAKAVKNSAAPENKDLDAWEILDHLQTMVESMELRL